jgi:hypothetical protein
VRRVLALVAVLTVGLPATALATELEEVLARSQEASYSAEQTISCSTPDGVRDAVVRITQSGHDLTLSSSVTDDVEIAAGSGNWSLRQGGGLVAEAAVDAGEAGDEAAPLYAIAEERVVEFLGRPAMSYLLVRDGRPRAELVVDDETGALVEVVTFTDGGDVYCDRRFVSFESEMTSATVPEAAPEQEGTPPVEVGETALPDVVAGFTRLDEYEDEDGVRFAYYSDGFFSFALFETPAVVTLGEPVIAEFESGLYQRLFTAGQVTYVWETRTAGMALVGDLPPDLHAAVLAEMPRSEDPGFLRRWWRNIFG